MAIIVHVTNVTCMRMFESRSVLVIALAGRSPDTRDTRDTRERTERLQLLHLSCGQQLQLQQRQQLRTCYQGCLHRGVSPERTNESPESFLELSNGHSTSFNIIEVQYFLFFRLSLLLKQA